MFRFLMISLLLAANLANAGQCQKKFKANYAAKLDSSIVDKVMNTTPLFAVGGGFAGVATSVAVPGLILGGLAGFGVGTAVLLTPLFIANSIDNARERSALALVSIIDEAKQIVDGQKDDPTPAFDRLAYRITKKTGTSPDRVMLANRIIEGDKDGSICTDEVTSIKKLARKFIP